MAYYLEGYFCLYGCRTSLHRYDEVIRPGAFKRSLAAARKLPVLIDHDAGLAIANLDGNLLLTDTPTGLRFAVRLPDTPLGVAVRNAAAAGLLPGTSFGFGQPDCRWSHSNGRDLREVVAADLSEVSILLNKPPAYQETKRHLILYQTKHPALQEMHRRLLILEAY